MKTAEIQATDLVVVIPCLNEAAHIEARVADVVRRGAACIVADGGSTDGTRMLALRAGATVTEAAPGRANQLNAGALRARLDHPTARWLLFLHADVRLPQINRSESERGEGRSVSNWAAGLDNSTYQWARFDVRLQAERPSWYCSFMLPIVAATMNLRSALSGICTGDQGLFVTQELFEQVGGYPPILLMEDIEISLALKRRVGRPYRIRTSLAVSARRWERDGILRTVGSMWWTRLRYYFGTPVDVLHAAYYRRR